jgi:hypothetical protein
VFWRSLAGAWGCVGLFWRLQQAIKAVQAWWVYSGSFALLHLTTEFCGHVTQCGLYLCGTCQGAGAKERVFSPVMGAVGAFALVCLQAVRKRASLQTMPAVGGQQACIGVSFLVVVVGLRMVV